MARQREMTKIFRVGAFMESATFVQLKADPVVRFFLEHSTDGALSNSNEFYVAISLIIRIRRIIAEITIATVAIVFQLPITS